MSSKKRTAFILTISLIWQMVNLLVIALFSYAIIGLYFLFSGYGYVNYGGERYVTCDSLSFSDDVIFDENGEYSGYRDGTEVYVKINGWFLRKMVLVNSEGNNFLFDYERTEWLVKESFLPADLNIDSIEKITVCSFQSDNSEYELTREEIISFLQQTEKLKTTDNMMPEIFSMPHEDSWGNIKIKAGNHPENSGYYMFYYSRKDNRVFLMSMSDSFGFEYGRYIYIELPRDK